MQLTNTTQSLKTPLKSLQKWAISGLTTACLLATSALPALAVNTQISRKESLRNCDLDIPFVPDDNGLNKVMRSLDDHGVKPILVYYGDFLANPVGGLRQSANWFQMVIYGVDLNLEKLMGWKGGEFLLTGMDTGGDDLQNNVGTSFTPSQAVTFRGSALFKMLLTQHLFDDKLQVTVGRTSVGSLYARPPLGGITVSGAVNGNPISLLYDAAGFHASGRANWMANIKVKPTDDTYVQSGIFQVTTNRMNKVWYNGCDFSFRQGDGVILLAEAGWSPTFCKQEATPALDKEVVQHAGFDGLPGLYQFGGYYQNYSTKTILGDATEQNAYGFYLQGQQMLWRSHSNADHNFSIWSGLTYSPQQEIAMMPIMAYGGLDWSGLIPHRDKDQFMLDYYIGSYSQDYSLYYINQRKGPRTVETVLEASYIIQLTRQIQFQPDVQWFIQPGGNKSIPNSLVLGFQVSFAY